MNLKKFDPGGKLIKTDGQGECTMDHSIPYEFTLEKVLHARDKLPPDRAILCVTAIEDCQYNDHKIGISPLMDHFDQGGKLIQSTRQEQLEELLTGIEGNRSSSSLCIDSRSCFNLRLCLTPTTDKEPPDKLGQSVKAVVTRGSVWEEEQVRAQEKDRDPVEIHETSSFNSDLNKTFKERDYRLEKGRDLEIFSCVCAVLKIGI